MLQVNMIKLGNGVVQHGKARSFITTRSITKYTAKIFKGIHDNFP